MGPPFVGGERALYNMQRGAPLSDYLVVLPNNLNWVAPEARRAMNTVVGIARDLAPGFGVDVATAGVIGVAAFAMAWEVLINNNDLSGDIVIPAASLTSTTSAQCTDQSTKCLAGCEMIGQIEACSTTCSSTSTCQVSPTSTGITIITTTLKPWTVSGNAISAAVAPSATPNIKCGNVGTTAGSVEFLTSKFGEFCGHDFSINQDQSWSSNNVKYALHYKNPGKGYCNAINCASTLNSGVKLCKSPYRLISEDHHSFQPADRSSTGEYDSHSIFKPGLASIDCGDFSWNITDDTPVTALTQTPPVCDQESAFPNHGNVQLAWIIYHSGSPCAGASDKNMKAGDPAIDWRTVESGVGYHYNIQWIPGCKTTTDTQNVGIPLAVQNPGPSICQNVFITMYNGCNNEGVGGSIDMGCLRYTFDIAQS